MRQQLFLKLLELWLINYPGFQIAFELAKCLADLDRIINLAIGSLVDLARKPECPGQRCRCREGEQTAQDHGGQPSSELLARARLNRTKLLGGAGPISFIAGRRPG